MTCCRGVEGGQLSFCEIVYCEVKTKQGQSIEGIVFELEFCTNKGSIDVIQERRACYKKIETSGGRSRVTDD